MKHDFNFDLDDSPCNVQFVNYIPERKMACSFISVDKNRGSHLKNGYKTNLKAMIIEFKVITKYPANDPENRVIHLFSTIFKLSYLKCM